MPKKYGGLSQIRLVHKPQFTSGLIYRWSKKTSFFPSPTQLSREASHLLLKIPGQNLRLQSEYNFQGKMVLWNSLTSAIVIFFSESSV